MEKKYGLVIDGTYTHISICNHYEGDYCQCGQHHEEIFKKFIDAKMALVCYMKDHLDDWRSALKNAHKVRKANISEE